MMKAIYKIIIGLFALTTFFACDDYNMFEKELYVKQIYFVSDEKLTFPLEYALDDENETQYFSIAYGGTNPIDKDVNVSFSLDKSILDAYNYSNYDIDTIQYAQLFPEAKYNIPNTTVTLKLEDPNPYVAVPVRIVNSDLEGLSPDSIYFIPLTISKVSDYTVSPSKQSVLCRVYFKNRFASVKTITRYAVSGFSQREGQTEETSSSIMKTVVPISKNAVRILVGSNSGSEKLSEINRFGLNIAVDNNHKLELYPFDSTQLEVESLTSNEENFAYNNTYNPLIKSFFLYYKYRNKDEKGVWSKWTTVKESVTRIIYS